MDPNDTNNGGNPHDDMADEARGGLDQAMETPSKPEGTDPTEVKFDADDFKALSEALGEEAPAPKPDEKPAGEAPKPDDTKPPADETPEAKVAREAAEKAAADAAAAAADDGKPKPDEAVEKEIEGFQLKDKAAERFRELSATKAEYEPVRAVMQELKIEGADQLRLMAQDAQAGYQIVEQVQATGADATQYGQVLEHLELVNKAFAGDLKAAERAWDQLTSQMGVIGRILGREAPGVFDPLAEHADLKAEVDEEKITRTRALEIAAQRNREKLAGERQTQIQQAQQQNTQAEEAKQQAIDEGRKALNALGPQLAASDPGGVEAFKAKQGMLVQLVKDVAAKYPPSQWVQQVTLGYFKLKVPGAAPPPAPSNGAPLRSPGPGPALMPEFDDPRAALDAAIDSADKGA